MGDESSELKASAALENVRKRFPNFTTVLEKAGRRIEDIMPSNINETRKALSIEIQPGYESKTEKLERLYATRIIRLLFDNTVAEDALPKEGSEEYTFIKALSLTIDEELKKVLSANGSKLLLSMTQEEIKSNDKPAQLPSDSHNKNQDIHYKEKLDKANLSFENFSKEIKQAEFEEAASKINYAHALNPRKHSRPVKYTGDDHPEYKDLTGDELKTRILMDFKKEIDAQTDVKGVNDVVDKYKNNNLYNILAQAQDRPSAWLGRLVGKQGAVKAFDKIVENGLRKIENAKPIKESVTPNPKQQSPQQSEGTKNAPKSETGFPLSTEGSYIPVQKRGEFIRAVREKKQNSKKEEIEGPTEGSSSNVQFFYKK